jgi:hypothetical protein
MIIDVAWRQFSAVKPYLFNSKNKLVCQEHPENPQTSVVIKIYLFVASVKSGVPEVKSKRCIIARFVATNFS